MEVLVSKVVLEFWFVAHLALTCRGSECRHLREEALQQAANQGRFHQTEHVNISTSKKEKIQHYNKVRSHQTDLYKHAIEVIQIGKHDNDKVVMTKHHFEPLWQYFKITCDPFRLLLLLLLLTLVHGFNPSLWIVHWPPFLPPCQVCSDSGGVIPPPSLIVEFLCKCDW